MRHRAVRRGLRLAPGPACSSGISRAGAAAGTRRGRGPRVTWPRTCRQRTRRRPPSRRRIGGWSPHAGRYRSEPIVLIRPWARGIPPRLAAQVPGKNAALWVIEALRQTQPSSICSAGPILGRGVETSAAPTELASPASRLERPASRGGSARHRVFGKRPWVTIVITISELDWRRWRRR